MLLGDHLDAFGTWFYNKTPVSSFLYKIPVRRVSTQHSFFWGEGSGVPSPMGIEHSQIPAFDHSANNWCLLAGFLKYPCIQSYHLPRAWGSLRYNSNTSTVSQTGIGLHFWKTNRLTHFELLKDLPPKLRKTGRLEALLQRAKWINYSTTLHQLEISGPFGGDSPC